MNLMTLLQSVAASDTGSPMVIRIFEVNHLLGAVWLDGCHVLGCVADGGLSGEAAFLRLYEHPGVGGFRVYQSHGDPFAHIDLDEFRASGPLGDLAALILRTACRLDELACGNTGAGCLDFEGLA